MPKPTDNQERCDACSMPNRPLVKGRCARCHLLYGPPPEKPKNGTHLRRPGALDHSAFKERLHFVAASRRVH